MLFLLLIGSSLAEDDALQREDALTYTRVIYKEQRRYSRFATMLANRKIKLFRLADRAVKYLKVLNQVTPG